MCVCCVCVCVGVYVVPLYSFAGVFSLMLYISLYSHVQVQGDLKEMSVHTRFICSFVVVRFLSWDRRRFMTL